MPKRGTKNKSSVSGKKDDCEEDTPGPAQYTLPPLLGCKDHDVTHWRNPCYSFGMKTQPVISRIQPGPANYTVTNVTRHGKITSPRAPMSFRLDPKPLFPGPGPGQYSPEKHINSSLQRAPAYPFGVKHNPKDPDPTPGPNAYNIPSPNVNGKKGPSYTMLGRRKGGKGSETPGPSAYGIPSIALIKRRNPAYTLTARKTDKAPPATPGPGAYNPNAAYILPAAANFKFTGRTGICTKPYILPIDNEF